MPSREHLLRERLEQMERALSDAARIISDEARRTRAIMGTVPTGWPHTEEEQLAALAQDFTTEAIELAESLQEMLYRAYEGLMAIPIPPPPPLDLDNVPTPIMYGATDAEAAKHGMKGDR